MTKYLDYDGVSKLWGKTKNHVAGQIKANVTDKKGVANGIASLDANGRVPIAQLGNLDTQVFIVVEKLPTSGIKTDKIYIVKDSSTAGDLYQEYYYTGGAWEKLGTHQLQVDWTTLNNHIANKSNPHGVTKAQVGLGSVDNTSDAAKPVSTAQATAIAAAKKAGTDAQADITSHANNKSNPHGVTKAQVGLGNVDNTSDAAKPVSTAQKAALDLKADKKGGNDFTGTQTFFKAETDYQVKIDGETIVLTKGEGDTTISKNGISLFDGSATEAFATDGSTIDTSVFAKTTTVNSQLSNKVDKVSGKGLSTNDYTTTEKNKLAGIPADANHTTVDAALNNTSTNPVQNKAVYTALSGKVDTSTYNAKISALENKDTALLNTIADKADKTLLNSYLPLSGGTLNGDLTVNKAAISVTDGSFTASVTTTGIKMKSSGSTAENVYTFPEKSGTLALQSDVDLKVNKTDIVAITDAELEALLV